VASARTRAVTVAVGALVVWVAAVAVAAWASGGVAPELSSDVTSLPDFGVSYDPHLNQLIAVTSTVCGRQAKGLRGARQFISPMTAA
jgi:hypothetical protein